MSIFPKALGGGEEGRGDGRNGGKRDGSEHEAVGWVLGGKGALKTKELHHVCVCVCVLLLLHHQEAGSVCFVVKHDQQAEN